MRYGSLCSGIEAATVAWHPLGWEPVFFSEIEKFPNAVLAQRWPDVPNFGDMTKFKEWPHVAIDLLVGGTPCQSFSVAGLRKGLDDPRGNLALTFLAIVDRLRPKWMVWENVPGVRSTHEGRGLAAFLGGLSQLGYGWAYRSLDAQYFGLAQRRERVFVVGHLGDWRRAAAVLFERESLSGNPAPSREAKEDLAPCLDGRAGRSGENGFNVGGRCLNGHPGGSHQDAESETFVVDVAGTLAGSGAGTERPAGQANEHDFLVAHTLKGEGHDASEDGTGRGVPIVGFNNRQDPVVSDDISQPLGAEDNGQAIGLRVRQGMRVRRLVPAECEALQGFPRGYTLVTYRGKPAADGPRYRAIGNSMAVLVMRWIGKRIDHVAALTRAWSSCRIWA